ncbi:hypothetical protein H5410_027124 [Solanum commersonii]|uniref:Uncharacterized protein n=1 Tax=Solanum commersonii TaxID=4109 RepID=A0A9J5Z0W5_SOLCO|nr:hypothetical protein H5410_027124 [Solanum commersonii]
MVEVPAPAQGQSHLAATPLRMLSVSHPQPEEAQEDVKRTCPRRGSPSSRHFPSDSGLASTPAVKNQGVQNVSFMAPKICEVTKTTEFPRPIHCGGRKRTSARRRPLNRSGVRERSSVGGACHHCFAVECERETTLASGEENRGGSGCGHGGEEMKMGEGESICDFAGKNDDDSGDGFLRSNLFHAIEKTKKIFIPRKKGWNMNSCTSECS